MQYVGIRAKSYGLIVTVTNFLKHDSFMSVQDVPYDSVF